MHKSEGRWKEKAVDTVFRAIQAGKKIQTARKMLKRECVKITSEKKTCSWDLHQQVCMSEVATENMLEKILKYSW